MATWRSQYANYPSRKLSRNALLLQIVRTVCINTYDDLQLMLYQLFPRIPRHNLRRATEYIKVFAKEQGLDFHTYYFIHGNARVLGVLRDVAEQVSVLGKVASAQARGELGHHH